MRIFVTGESSSLYREIEHSLFLDKHEIIFSKSVGWRLGEWILNAEDFDICLHFAHSRENASENILGTRVLAEQFNNKLIYISSLASHIDARSEYAKTKYRCEEIVKFYSGSVVSAGVFLDANIFGIFQFLEKIPKFVFSGLIPFSKTPFAITDKNDFSDMLRECLESNSFKANQISLSYFKVTTITDFRSSKWAYWYQRIPNLDHFWRICLNLFNLIVPKKFILIDRLLTFAYPPNWIKLEYKGLAESEQI